MSFFVLWHGVFSLSSSHIVVLRGKGYSDQNTTGKKLLCKVLFIKLGWEVIRGFGGFRNAFFEESIFRVQKHINVQLTYLFMYWLIDWLIDVYWFIYWSSATLNWFSSISQAEFESLTADQALSLAFGHDEISKYATELGPKDQSSFTRTSDFESVLNLEIARANVKRKKELKTEKNARKAEREGTRHSGPRPS